MKQAKGQMHLSNVIGLHRQSKDRPQGACMKEPEGDRLWEPTFLDLRIRIRCRQGPRHPCRFDKCTRKFIGMVMSELGWAGGGWRMAEWIVSLLPRARAVCNLQRTPSRDAMDHRGGPASKKLRACALKWFLIITPWLADYDRASMFITHQSELSWVQLTAWKNAWLSSRSCSFSCSLACLGPASPY